jgi:hypothetical protein
MTILWLIALIWTTGPIAFVLIAAMKRGADIPRARILVMGIGAFGVVGSSVAMTRIQLTLVGIIGILNPVWALRWWLTKGRHIGRSRVS